MIVATNRPCVFRLQHIEEFPRGGLLRPARKGKPATLFMTYSQASAALDRGRYFTARNPQHWYAREWAEFNRMILRANPRENASTEPR